jgi:AcrR family transcriptional regulator
MIKMEKREAILNAAMHLITENGFHGTPMSKVAKKANVAAGTIYHHFENKEDLINQLYSNLKKKFGEALLEGGSANGTVKELFYQLWINMYEYFIKNPEEFRFLEQYANSPFIEKEIREANQQTYQPAIEFLIQGMEKGVLRAMEPILMANLLYGAVVAVAKIHLAGQLNIDQEKLQQAIQSCWDGVRIN